MALSTRLRSACRSLRRVGVERELGVALHLEGHPRVVGARLEQHHELARRPRAASIGARCRSSSPREKDRKPSTIACRRSASAATMARRSAVFGSAALRAMCVDRPLMAASGFFTSCARRAAMPSRARVRSSLLAAQLLAALGQLEGGSLVTPRHGAAHAVDARHHEERGDQRDADVQRRDASGVGQRERQLPQARVPDDREQRHGEAEREEHGALEPARIVDRERGGRQHHRAHDEHGAGETAGGRQKHEEAADADEEADLAEDGVPRAGPQHEHHGHEAHGDDLQRRAHVRLAGQNEQRDDAHLIGEHPREAPAG